MDHPDPSFPNQAFPARLHWRVGQMNVDAVAKRIPSLPKRYLNLLACMAQGMSNDQIASKLGYKSKESVASTIHEINTRIGLVDVCSRTEKRQLAVEAFRISNVEFPKIKVSLDDDAIDDILNLSRRCADRVVPVLAQGYEIDAIEVVFRKRND